jgi:hypothetical protein
MFEALRCPLRRGPQPVKGGTSGQTGWMANGPVRTDVARISSLCSRLLARLVLRERCPPERLGSDPLRTTLRHSLLACFCGGNLEDRVEVLRYAHERGCPWDESTLPLLCCWAMAPQGAAVGARAWLPVGRKHLLATVLLWEGTSRYCGTRTSAAAVAAGHLCFFSLRNLGMRRGGEVLARLQGRPHDAA